MEPVLVTPDLDREMRVEADASDFATGGMLSMKCEDCYKLKTLGLVKRVNLVLG